MAQESVSAESESADDDDVVILIHGTFAGDKTGSDRGSRWWQRDSAMWTWLGENLPKGVTLPPGETRLFHWSGANTQSERLKASLDLLALLLDLERKGRGYHLVGHSHGGSVIWEALVSARVLHNTRHDLDWPLWHLLREHHLVSGDDLVTVTDYNTGDDFTSQHPDAVRRIRGWAELAGLRSWTTVGTPFLHFLPRRRLFVRGWQDPRYSFEWKSWDLRGILAMTMTVIPLAAAFGFVWFAHGTQGHAQLRDLLYVGICFVAAFTTLIFHSHQDLALTLAAREQTAMKVFQERSHAWLGLWAEQDEALAFLGSLAMPGRYDYLWLSESPRSRPARTLQTGTFGTWLPPLRISPPNSTLHYVPIMRLSKPMARLLLPLYSLYNRTVAKRLSSLVSHALIRMAQGNDISGADLAFVSAWPLPVDGLGPGLPARISERLAGAAEAATSKLGPALRQSLISTALEGSPFHSLKAEIPAQDAAGSLVHTAYFDDPDVRGLIALHIARRHAEVKSSASPTTAAVECGPLSSWLDHNAAAVAAISTELAARRVGRT